MTWFTNPQRDSRDDIRAAQQALVYAGYPHAEAVSEVSTHLGRVRAAMSTRRDVTVAGFLAGALMAAIAATAVVLGVWVSGALSSTAIIPESPFGCPFYGSCPGELVIGAFDDPGAPLGAWPVVAIGSPILGLAGAGAAHITRGRWRRAGAASTFSDLAPRRVYLLELGALGLAMAALVVGVVSAFAGSQFSGSAVLLLVLIGIPLVASVFAAIFPRTYAWMLPRISPLDAAAYARPIVEREAALQVVADRDFYARNPYYRSRDDRASWAEAVLDGQGFAAPSARREALRRRMDRGSGAYSRGVPLWRRLWRYALISAAVGLSVAWLIGWWAGWILGAIQYPYSLNRLLDVLANVLSLSLGLAVGAAVAWIYANYLEGV